jgi:hypothetical protein
MSTKAGLAAGPSNFCAALVSVVVIAFVAAPESARAAQGDATATIERQSSDAKATKMEEPSYETREERLKAKPLDWKATVGKPRRVAPPGSAVRKPARKAPASVQGGAPDPKAEEEARKLHPEDWKK